MANELAVRPSNTLATYDKVTNPIDFSKEIAKSAELLCGAPAGSGTAIGMLMLCEGLTVFEVSKRYHFIQGRPSMRADAMLAEFRLNHGGDYEVIERSPQRAAIKFTDARGRVYERQFTLEELNDSRWPWADWKKATKLWRDDPAACVYRDNYGTPKDRETMLFARLVSDSLRFICPELVAGVYTPEEMSDLGPTVEQAPKAPTLTMDERIAAAAKTTRDAGSVVTSPVEGEVLEGEVVSSTVADTQPAGDVPEDPSAPGSIRRRQGERIRQLFGVLGMTEEQQRAALAKRHASVINNLSSDDAEGLLDRLTASAESKGLLGKSEGE